MYSAFNEEKCVVAERFIKNLKNKIYKYMTTIGKHVIGKIGIGKNFNVLDYTVKDYSNATDNLTKMKPEDIKNYNLREYIEEFHKKDPKFKIGDHVRISKYKNIFS